ncbi:hypothetical protein PILCRDRAFT_83239 [Piloderma croceum F 1598]|uniref:Uncharacterized protein n=1 Tax=Piloderma croceum (strain F 1598) TaxID=765440 RepID=A0A0C3BZ32_PILCF|nr:hypothetical protein PILCRDRAFT_83239 [Piloderma croceum F 1598]
MASMSSRNRLSVKNKIPAIRRLCFANDKAGKVALPSPRGRRQTVIKQVTSVRRGLLPDLAPWPQSDAAKTCNLGITGAHIGDTARHGAHILGRESNTDGCALFSVVPPSLLFLAARTGGPTKGSLGIRADPLSLTDFVPGPSPHNGLSSRTSTFTQPPSVHSSGLLIALAVFTLRSMRPSTFNVAKDPPECGSRAVELPLC